MKTLRWVGLALQVIGVVIAATGLWLTWREHGRDRSFWGPIVRPIRSGWAWTKERAIRLWVKLGGRRSVTVHAVAGSALGSVSMSGTVRVGWAPAPDIEADPAGFAREDGPASGSASRDGSGAPGAARRRGEGAFRRGRIAPVGDPLQGDRERATDPRCRGRRYPARSVRRVPRRGRNRAPGVRLGVQPD